MENMTMKEVSTIAKNKGITLSYKCDVTNKRKRYTKVQLIKMINAITTTTDNTVVATTDSSIAINHNHAIKQAKQLLQQNDIAGVNKLIKHLQAIISDNKRNKLLIASISNKLNIINAMLKMQKVVLS